MEMSVAMKRAVFLFALLLAVPALTPAQTQTRERRFTDSAALRAGSITVRNRIVGPARAANHVEKLKIEAITDAPPIPEPTRNSSSPVNQDGPEPKWGNTAVVIRSGPSERNAPLESLTTGNRKVAGRDNQPVKKLVQQTSLVRDVPKPSPVPVNAASAKPLAVRGPQPTVVYHVGVGDVLDIRLTNLPTRESTLYTVLRNGLLEYPLLSGPLSVGGMTTAEIANLLSNEIKVIKTPRVRVEVRDYASHAVVIMGLVDSPGRKTMRREAMPLFAMLAEALPRTEASVATIVRDGKSQPVSLNDEAAMSTLVLSGDVIRVSAGGSAATRFVYVGGDVVSRGEKEFRNGMTLTQAILSAGGAARGNKTTVKVARRDSNGFLRTNEYNLQSIEEGKSQDPLLEAGDRIEVTRSM